MRAAYRWRGASFACCVIRCVRASEEPGVVVGGLTGFTRGEASERERWKSSGLRLVFERVSDSSSKLKHASSPCSAAESGSGGKKAPNSRTGSESKCNRPIISEVRKRGGRHARSYGSKQEHRLFNKTVLCVFFTIRRWRQQAAGDFGKSNQKGRAKVCVQIFDPQQQRPLLLLLFSSHRQVVAIDDASPVVVVVANRTKQPQRREGGR